MALHGDLVVSHPGKGDGRQLFEADADPPGWSATTFPPSTPLDMVVRVGQNPPRRPTSPAGALGHARGRGRQLGRGLPGPARGVAGLVIHAGRALPGDPADSVEPLATRAQNSTGPAADAAAFAPCILRRDAGVLPMAVAGAAGAALAARRGPRVRWAAARRGGLRAGYPTACTTESRRDRRPARARRQKPVMLRRRAAGNVAFAPEGSASHRRSLTRSTGCSSVSDSKSAVAARSARRLSGGEQQRLAVARALARDPEVLFLDEPTASLDPAATKTVEDIIARTSARGVKIVMSTHDLGQARRLAGDVVFLAKAGWGAHLGAGFLLARDTRGQSFLAGDLVV